MMSCRIEICHHYVFLVSCYLSAVQQYHQQVISSLTPFKPSVQCSIRWDWDTLSSYFKALPLLCSDPCEWLIVHKGRKGRTQRRRQSIREYEGQAFRSLKMDAHKYVYEEKKHDKNQNIFGIKRK